MSVFKVYKGKRVKPDDPNYEKATWYMYARAGKGKVLHKALRAVANEEEAKEIERTMVRAVISKAEGKHAVRFARKLAGLPETETPPEYIYIFESGGYYKIGRSTNIAARLKEITRTIVPFTTTIVLVALVKDSFQVEKTLHEEYAKYRAKGEWFLLEPWQLRLVKYRIIELQTNELQDSQRGIAEYFQARTANR